MRRMCLGAESKRVDSPARRVENLNERLVAIGVSLVEHRGKQFLQFFG